VFDDFSIHDPEHIEPGRSVGLNLEGGIDVLAWILSLLGKPLRLRRGENTHVVARISRGAVFKWISFFSTIQTHARHRYFRIPVTVPHFPM